MSKKKCTFGTSKMQRESHAALFGIEYLNSADLLPGCANDVGNMGVLLFDQAGYDVVRVYNELDTPDQVTRRGMESVLWELIATSYTKNLEKVWIHFSGHGGGQKDQRNGGDEQDGQDEFICPVDYLENGVITDDQFGHMLKLFNPNTKVVCVFDSCNSVTMGDLPFVYTKTGRTVEVNTQHPSNVIMLSACRDDQVSYSVLHLNGQNEFTGLMTSSLIDCIRYRQQKGEIVKVKSVIKDVQRLLIQRGFKQVPVITSSQPVYADTILLQYA
jgi:hypothetical protein